MIAEESAAGRAERVVPARAALAGNPSDGFGGAVVAVPIHQLGAGVTGTRCETGAAPADPVGPDGLLDIVRAAEQVWAEHHPDPSSRRDGIAWRVTTTIPRQVGLAGSSAVAVGSIEVLAALEGVEAHPDVVASLALRAETDVLGIPGGLQDRVVQARRAPVFMDFSPGAVRQVEGMSVGDHVDIDPVLVPPLVLGWRVADAESSAVPHSDLRERAGRGDEEVLEAMRALRDAATACHVALRAGNAAGVAAQMRRSIELRAAVIELHPRHRELVDVAHSVDGVGANYAGSGGAIVALAPDGATTALHQALRAAGASTIEVRV